MEKREWELEQGSLDLEQVREELAPEASTDLGGGSLTYDGRSVDAYFRSQRFGYREENGNGASSRDETVKDYIRELQEETGAELVTDTRDRS